MPNLLAKLLRPVVATLVFAVVCCGIYPVLVWGIAQIAFRAQANGSLLKDREGRVVGSRLLGQAFSGERYFHSRPSAAGNGYDAANSSGSNLGPTSRKLHDLIQERLAAYRRENRLSPNQAVPADAVTASASGLDPHISPRNAELQIQRVARARGLTEAAIRELVKQHTTNPTLGWLGDTGVNVLTLNLALDAPGANNPRLDP